MSRRPSFQSAWAAFIAVSLPVAAVGKKIGGNVQIGNVLYAESLG